MLLVAGRRHLERRREVGPELEPVHPPVGVALGHLLVEDAAARRHPLDVTGPDDPLVPQAVLVLHGSGEHVGDRLDAAVRVPRESGPVVVRPVAAEVVEQEEGIELRGFAEPERAAQVHARALEGWLGLGELPDGSNSHDGLLLFGPSYCRRRAGGARPRRDQSSAFSAASTSASVFRPLTTVKALDLAASDRATIRSTFECTTPVRVTRPFSTTM